MSDLTVVLLPGLDGTGNLFRRLVDQTPPGFRTQVVSYPTDQVLGYDALEAMIRAQIPMDRPYIVLGESFSGPLSVALAANPIGDLVGVVMAATFVTPPALPVLRHISRGWVIRIPVPLWVMRLAMGTDDEELVKGVLAARGAAYSEVFAHRIRSTLAVDVRKQLAAITKPILYLQATQDRVVPARCLRDILEVRDDVHVEQLESTHYILQLHPVEAWAAIERFVASAE
ncbi:MAG: alpha/beta hydrolase [Acidobacteriota bacterium]|nr:alpha/beta hydrolase [Acidobacteriota bacterium]MDH3785594.1 alpha/beta hydrolase [Acidobacteriota bacterium]